MNEARPPIGAAFDYYSRKSPTYLLWLGRNRTADTRIFSPLLYQLAPSLTPNYGDATG